MPFGSAAPSNKRKANKIITDLSNISQNGKCTHTHTHAQINHVSHIFTISLSPPCDLIIQPAKCHIYLWILLCNVCYLQPVCMWTELYVSKSLHKTIKYEHTSSNTIFDVHATASAGTWLIIRQPSCHQSATITGNIMFRTAMQLMSLLLLVRPIF